MFAELLETLGGLRKIGDVFVERGGVVVLSCVEVKLGCVDFLSVLLVVFRSFRVFADFH